MGFVNLRDFKDIGSAKHVFTHLVWRMQGIYCRADAAPEDVIIAGADEFSARAFPTALRKYHEIANDILKKYEE